MKSKNIIDIELFRNRLRDRYKELGYTRKSLSKKADVSESTLDKWLNGKDNND
ncbi:MAG: helix-turn-helix transcriptional regulator, partial [Bacteroidales bacterium]|nr:helix-turn-helix transcriptional regulator [Bacteroidales bacterium]